MSHKLPWILVVVLGLALVWSHRPSAWKMNEANAETIAVAPSDFDKGFAVYDTTELLKKRKESKRAWMGFLNVPALYCGIYAIPAKGKDNQKPHDHDEVYYVISGTGKIQTGSGENQQTTSFNKGAVIYVRAEMEHTFVDVSADLELLVFFSTAKPTKK